MSLDVKTTGFTMGTIRFAFDFRQGNAATLDSTYGYIDKSLDGKWQRLNGITLVTDGDVKKGACLMCMSVNNVPNGTIIEYKNTKIEIGNIGSDWTPAPEDIVKSVDTEYYLSTSATSLSGGSWTTTAPTLVSGKYMWSRTKVVDGGDTIRYTPSQNGVCIASGNGSAGKGISSITEEYYLSTSKTTQTGGSWVTTPPTWSQGKYIWTRSKILYTNPTSTEYTTPICSSEWEAVNDLNLGSRNLLVNTNFKELVKGNAGLGTGIYAKYWNGYNGGLSDPTSKYHACIDEETFGEPVYMFNESNNSRNWKGINQSISKNNPKFLTHFISNKTDQYIVSMDVYQIKSGGKIYGGFYYTKDGTNKNDFYSGSYIFYNSNISIGSWKRVSAIVPYNHDAKENTDLIFYIYGYEFTSDDVVYIKNIKLEKGNKATDWTPAPEDVDEELLKKASKDYVDAGDGALKDSLKTAIGRIDSLEAKITLLTTSGLAESILTQTPDGWAFNMKKFNDGISNANDRITTEIEDRKAGDKDNKDNVDSIDKHISSVENGSRVSYVNIGTDANGNPSVLLGKSTSNFKVAISNTEIQFLDGQTKIAYINGHTFYGDNITAVRQLQVGTGRNSYFWEVRSNGNLGLNYKSR